MGTAYNAINELEKARETFNKILALNGDEDMKTAAQGGLQDTKRIEQQNKQKEKQMLQRMFKPKPESAPPVSEVSPVEEAKNIDEKKEVVQE